MTEKSTKPSKLSKSRLAIFAMPVLLFASGLFGLIAALVGDGIWDVAGWVGLGSLVACVAPYSFRTQRDR